MDKNVSSVNLDELKAARVALDKERGVETDPNMYNDYDPEKHKAEREQERLARENASNNDADVSLIENNDESIIESSEQTLESNDEIKVDLSEEDDDEIIINRQAESTENVDSVKPLSVSEINEEDDGEVNLNIYDTFADFEVNPERESSKEDAQVVEENQQESEIQAESQVEKNIDETGENSSLDDFLRDLDFILSEGESDNDTILETSEESESDETENGKAADENINSGNDEIDDFIQELDNENKNDSDELLIENNGDDFDREINVESKSEVKEVDDKSDEDLDFSGFEKVSEDKLEKSDDDFNTEILSDFSKLSTMADEIEAEENEGAKIENSSTEVEESEDESDIESDDKEPEAVEESAYPKIESFNFIDVISTDEFKDEDNFSYLLGKDEKGELVFSHLKDTCGTVVFSKNEEAVFSGFSSILLSLLLKNTPEEMQFVVCDAMFDSEFDVFENSSYMYFNRVAKNNREIVDTLVELSKEIETRYNNLVYAGVKSISFYNLQADERGSRKMPYIVVFINNYAKISQFLDNEKINTCIYNILKFGRIVGVYVMLSSAGEIERKEINYNLPTRIAYKTDDELESVKAITSEGAEKLVEDNEFLYSTVYDEEVRHLKVANLTKKEIELVIENLEN